MDMLSNSFYCLAQLLLNWCFYFIILFDCIFNRNSCFFLVIEYNAIKYFLIIKETLFTLKLFFLWHCLSHLFSQLSMFEWCLIPNDLEKSLRRKEQLHNLKQSKNWCVPTFDGRSGFLLKHSVSGFLELFFNIK